MFEHNLVKRSLAGGITVVALGFLTPAQAMSHGGGVEPASGTVSAAYTLPSNFHTDADSGGGYPNHRFIGASPASGTVSAAYTLPSNFHTDADSGGGYPNHRFIGASPASGTVSAAYTLPSNFHTDADSGGGYPNHRFIGASVQQAHAGFQWGDAGAGAAGVTLLLGIGALGARVTRRRTTQRHAVG